MAKVLDSGARINVPGVGRVEQYVRKAGPRWNPKTKTQRLRRAGKWFPLPDREAAKPTPVACFGKWLKSSS